MNIGLEQRHVTVFFKIAKNSLIAILMLILIWYFSGHVMCPIVGKSHNSHYRDRGGKSNWQKDTRQSKNKKWIHWMGSSGHEYLSSWQISHPHLPLMETGWNPSLAEVDGNLAIDFYGAKISTCSWFPEECKSEILFLTALGWRGHIIWQHRDLYRFFLPFKHGKNLLANIFLVQWRLACEDFTSKKIGRSNSFSIWCWMLKQQEN